MGVWQTPDSKMKSRSVGQREKKAGGKGGEGLKSCSLVSRKLLSPVAVQVLLLGIVDLYLALLADETAGKVGG